MTDRMVCEMDRNESKKKNDVVEAMLRVREKEMEQMGTEEQEGLTAEEHEEMFQKIVERLKAEGLMKAEHSASGRETADGSSASERKGVFCAGKPMEDADMDGMVSGGVAAVCGTNTGKGKIRWFQRRAAKVACICLVAGVAVFGVTMTGEANRLRLLQTVNEVLGTGDLMKTNNGDDRLVSGGNENKVRREIEEALQAEVPDFLYLPEGIRFESYELVSEVGYATMEYTYDKGYFYLNISNSLTDMSQGAIKEKEKKDKIETLSGEIEFVIKPVEDSRNKYEARWEHNNVAYDLVGEIGKDELIKILENLSYSM